MPAYKAQLEQDESGRWSAWIDLLPGCAVWGYTQAEALASLKDAAEAYLEDVAEAGEATNHRGEVVIEKPIATACPFLLT